MGSIQNDDLIACGMEIVSWICYRDRGIEVYWFDGECISLILCILSGCKGQNLIKYERRTAVYEQWSIRLLALRCIKPSQ